MIKKKNKISFKKAKRQLFDFIGEKLRDLSPKERRKRTEQAYQDLLGRRKGKSSNGETSKALGLSPNRWGRLVDHSSS